MNQCVREVWTKDEAPEDEATKTQNDSSINTEHPEKSVSNDSKTTGQHYVNQTDKLEQ